MNLPYPVDNRVRAFRTTALVAKQFTTNEGESMKVKATIETMASAVGFLALGMGLIYLASFGAIILAYFTMAPQAPGVL